MDSVHCLQYTKIWTDEEINLVMENVVFCYLFEVVVTEKLNCRSGKYSDAIREISSKETFESFLSLYQLQGLHDTVKCRIINGNVLNEKARTSVPLIFGRLAGSPHLSLNIILICFQLHLNRSL